MTSWKALACGLLGCVLVLGCGKPADPSKADKTKKADGDDDHEHGEGPHGGTIIDIAGVHAEFTVDHKTKQATIYMLDGNRAKKAEPVAADKLTLSIKTPQFQVDAVAAPQTDDPKGKASRFVATHDNFGKEQEFAGTLSGKINDKEYAEDFAEKAHDHDKKK